MIYVYPYKQGRYVVRNFREKAGWPTIKLENSRYRPRRGDVIVNWGSSNLPEWDNRPNLVRVLNTMAAHATDKIKAFNWFKLNNIPTPEWTSDWLIAHDWLLQGNTLFCRHLTKGHAGDGIEVVKPSDDVLNDVLPLAPLYTKAIGQCREYRFHVFGDEVKFVQQKKRRNGFRDADGNEPNGLIKNWDNGWVYVTQNISAYPQSAVDAAVKAVKCLGLDFGAVDVAVRQNEPYVFEVNTAPGIEGTTVDVYIEALKSLAGEV